MIIITNVLDIFILIFKNDYQMSMYKYTLWIIEGIIALGKWNLHMQSRCSYKGITPFSLAILENPK